MEKQLHVLVVDDDIALCELVRKAFELEGIEVDEAHHVVEADRIVNQRVPDAVILDIGLPGIDGLFYCQRLRENPKTRNVPIIAISGSDNAGTSALGVGATAFVHKPFDPLELMTLIERMIGLRPLAHAFGADVPADVTNEHLAELGNLIEIGRRRHELLEHAYRQTLSAIATSLRSGAWRRAPTPHASRPTPCA